METGARSKVYSVAELTRLIRSILERQIGHVWVEGELSNVRRPASGHLYLTLKDATAQIAAVLFKGDQFGMSVQPRDGMQVRVFGQLGVYERSGSYQIVIRQMEEAGQGALQARFEALKEKLRAEGLFEAARKRPLPLLPRHVGIVTSSTGAAIRDILTVATRRFPNLHLVLWPVKVQGEGAAEAIAEAIDGFNARGGVDALIVGRGGGSLEDLWAFNEEVVARALARSRIPTISAVGHEIDFTIADFVADVRAPTPSAAAEILVGRKDAFVESLRNLDMRLRQTLRERLLTARRRFGALTAHYVFREPGNAVLRHRQRVGELRVRMRHELERRNRAERQHIDDLAMRMGHRMELGARGARSLVERLGAQLRALNPLAVLERGYSLTRLSSGAVVRRAADVCRGDRVLTMLAHGGFESEVVERQEAS